MLYNFDLYLYKFQADAVPFFYIILNPSTI